MRTRVRYRKVRDPAGGGLIGSFFRTAQPQFEAEVRAHSILTLERLNQAFSEWLAIDDRAAVSHADRRWPFPEFVQRSASRLGKPIPYTFHGGSFLPIVEEPQPKTWDEVFASHTFHEIQMYYPMRVVRERRCKLIWNIAYPLPYPFASDLWAASTWQARWRKGAEAMYGKRTVG